MLWCTVTSSLQHHAILSRRWTSNTEHHRIDSRKNKFVHLPFRNFSFIKSSGTVSGVKYSFRTSSADTNRTSAAYFFSQGFMISQPGLNTHGASTNKT